MPEFTTADVETTIDVANDYLPLLDVSETPDAINRITPTSLQSAIGAAALGFLSKTSVVPKTANYAVQTTESGTTFTNEGTTAQRNFTLPGAAAGLVYSFVVQDSDGLTVTAAAGDTIRLGGTVSAAAGNTDSTTVGSVVRLEAINATEWVATSIVGTWVTT